MTGTFQWEQSLTNIYIMSNMKSQTKTVTYYVEGPDWVQPVSIDTDIFDTESSQLFEACARAIEQEMKKPTTFNIGALLIVKKTKNSRKEKLVSAYISLNNAAQYSLAEDLRKNFLKESGQDLAKDDSGISE
jgi:hypothetical protein